MQPNLEPEQEELLETLVEASRSVPRAERQFFLSRTDGPDFVEGRGLSGMLPVLANDLWALQAAGLLEATEQYTSGAAVFIIPKAGVDHYEALKKRSGEPLRQVEEDVRAYLDASRFRSTYGKAYERWSEAAELLWRADSQDELTTIGHKLREAMQEFATALVQLHDPPAVKLDPTKTLDRVSAVIKLQRPRLGTGRSDLLDASFDYWRASINIVQRQEHGGQKENEPLTWEDGRRAVFQTAVVMTEIDRTLQAQ